MATAFNKPEVWVIDSVVRRRGFVSNYFGSLGYLAYPMDPSDRLPSTGGREVIAFVNDDDAVVDRVLGCRENGPISCVVYSDSLKAKRVTNLLRRGIADLIDWPFEKQDFVDAVSIAETNLSAIVEEGGRGASARARVEAITPREREVLVGILAGKTSREIALDLGLSVRTVEVHRLNCIRRLGVKNTAEAVRIAMNSGCFKHSVEL
jgi:DNA-binding NarL/FixJ family response regulator